MESPLIVALARQMTVKDQMSAIANNIANMSTTAFKAERMMFREYVARTATGDEIYFPKHAGVHRVTTLGPITHTSNPLDVAIRGDGYFAVETRYGIRYTRNGHFSLDGEGRIVTSQGHTVLSTADQPLTIDTDAQEIEIAADGTVSADGNEVGTLKLVTFANKQGLERQGASLFRTTEPALPVEETQIIQNHLEGSNVEPILEMTRFMNAVGFYQSSKKVIDEEDQRQRRAIERLGGMPQ